MRAGRPPVVVPPLARARALGALVQPGEHAIAFASQDAESVLLGFALGGLEAGASVLVLTGTRPRAVAARLRAGGVGAPRRRPAALRVLSSRDVPGPLPEFLEACRRRALEEGYEGLAVAHACGPEDFELALAQDARLPRRLGSHLTLLCICTPESAGATPPERLWAAARRHARILCL